MAFHLALQRALRFAEEGGSPKAGGAGSSSNGSGSSTSGMGFGFGLGGVNVGNGCGNERNNSSGVGNNNNSSNNSNGGSSSSGGGGNGSGQVNGGYGLRAAGYSHRRNASRDHRELVTSSSSLVLDKGVKSNGTSSSGSLPLPLSKSMNSLSAVMADRNGNCAGGVNGMHGSAIELGGANGKNGNGSVGSKKSMHGHSSSMDRLYNGGKSSRDKDYGSYKESRRTKWCTFITFTWIIFFLLLAGVTQLGGRHLRLSRGSQAYVVKAEFFSSGNLNLDSHHELAKDVSYGNMTMMNADNLNSTSMFGKRQRIILVTAAYNHIVDGVSMTLNRLVRWLLDQGHEVVVVAPTSPQPMIEHAGDLLAVPSIAVPGRQEYRLSMRLPRDVRSKMAQFEPTVVHIATPDIVGHSAQDWGRRHNVPVVCSYHTRFNSYLPYYYLGWLDGVYWYLFRKFNAKCKHMYVPSETVKTELVEHGISNSTIRMWSRGVDTTSFSPEFRSSAWRKNIGVSDDTPIVVLVSRIVWEKGLDVFVKVIRSLEKKNIKFKSVVVGEGPARKAMQKQLPETIFLGKQTGFALATAYASSDIYVFPSHTETFGATSLEAMSSGLPVVVAGGPSDSMVDNETSGFIVSPFSCETCFTEFAQRLILNATLRTEMGKRSRSIAVHKFQWDSVFKQLVSHYYELNSTTSTEGQQTV